MAQDFAKKRQTRKAPQRKPRSATKKAQAKSGSHWSWFISGLLSGLFVAAISYFGLAMLTLPAPNQVATDPASSVDSSAGRTALDFVFYRQLAESEVEVDVVQVALEAETPERELVNYLIQAGSFQIRQEAETQRAKIILLGMDAKIAPGTVYGKTWYRVQVGPYSGRRSTEVAIGQLSENNIDSIPLIMR